LGQRGRAPLNLDVRFHVSMETHDSAARSDERGRLAGLVLTLTLFALLVACLRFAPGKFHRGWRTILVGAYSVTWGFVLLAAYFSIEPNFFLRAVLWVSERVPGLGGKKLLRLWSAIFILGGGIVILIGIGVIGAGAI
jgi:hypothetical protein